jgi:putative FmdB family regulatory protein
MPTYEYVCKTCGESFEVFQSFSDKPLKKHKGCGGDLQKVFHSRGIVFKGSGFYATDKRAPVKTGDGSKTSKKERTSDKGSKETAKASSSSDD